MKDQYFGDINDYKKYGLLRAVLEVSSLRLLVAWMLTPDDESSDGGFVSYLEQADKWSFHDPVLFEGQKELIGNNKRRVSLIENTALLQDAEYFSAHVPDVSIDRAEWFKSLQKHARNCDLVFLDPDNGLEVKSTPYGRKNSSKFLYWREVQALWSSGNSLLIYQHFIREKRLPFVKRMLGALEGATPGSFVEAFSTKYVVFLMALQPGHQRLHEKIVKSVEKQWKGAIQHWELTLAQPGPLNRFSIIGGHDHID